ncbi:MAG: FHA domain-containing protein [Armatimonadetes bacterium]|nr:FHA domain-containing protein [Anaerolineae bacterium]
MPLEHYQLTLRIADCAPIIKQLRQPILLGRSDHETNFMPDIDLNPVGGDEAGVSRRHATLIPDSNGLLVKDLKSTNGTFINERELKPDMLYRILPGDELRLGYLRIRVTYQMAGAAVDRVRHTQRLKVSYTMDLSETLSMRKRMGTGGRKKSAMLPPARVAHEHDKTIIAKPNANQSSIQYLTKDQRAALSVIKTVLLNKDLSEGMMIYIAQKAVEDPEWGQNRRMAVLQTACSFGYVARDNAELMQEVRRRSNLQFGMHD